MARMCKTQPRKRKQMQMRKRNRPAKVNLLSRCRKYEVGEQRQTALKVITNSQLSNIVFLFCRAQILRDKWTCCRLCGMLRCVLNLWICVWRKPSYLNVVTTPHYPRWGVQFWPSLKDQGFCVCVLHTRPP